MKNLETRKYYAPDCSPQRNRQNDVLNNSQSANAQEIPSYAPILSIWSPIARMEKNKVTSLFYSKYSPTALWFGLQYNNKFASIYDHGNLYY